jgi:uncharacterized protein YegL
MKNISKVTTTALDKIRKFREEQRGSIMATAALSLPLLMLSVAVTVQYSMASNAKSKVQQATDSALMAGAIEANKVESLTDILLVEKKLEENAKNFLKAGLGEISNLDYKINKVSFNPLTKLATLKVDFKYPTIMDQITGDENKYHSTEAQVYLSEEKRKPLSMYLVLDKSGSMGWDGRMVALKAAVASLTTKMVLEDPDQEYVRMGAIAYDSRNYWKRVDLNWNPVLVNAYTQALWANGGTNSSDAMKVAYKAMKGNSEEKVHEKKNGGEPTKFILFLTDGANNRSSYDKNTKKHCNNAKNKENVQIYSIAFQAPKSAQELLKNCASSNAHYFEADNAAELIASFDTIGNAAAKALAFSK